MTGVLVLQPVDKSTVRFVDAANDVYSGLMVYRRLEELAKTNEVELEPALFTHHIGQPNTMVTVPKTVSKTSKRPAKSSETETAMTAASEVETTDPSSNVVAATEDAPAKKGLSPRLLRAYTLWHEQKLSLDEMRAEMRSPENPLATSTVMYV